MSIRAYWQLMRFHKPAGTVLLFWPVCGAFLLASQSTASMDYLMGLIFTAGVILSRAAGCIVNDLWDQPFDGQVARTLHRPLADGRLSRRQAKGCLACVLLFGLFPLFLLLNPRAQAYAGLAAALTVLYPSCKRFFPFPQCILGITFNMGVLMVFAQIHNHIPLEGLYLYLASIAWTFAYDTAYALSDKSDDIKLGLHSSAITLASWTEPAIVISLLLAGYAYAQALHLGYPITLALLCLCAVYLWTKGIPLLRKNPLNFFYRQTIVGGAMVGVIVSYALVAPPPLAVVLVLVLLAALLFVRRI